MQSSSTLAVPIPLREQGNNLYPLPPDYFDLDGEGQRQARVNACRQWLLHNEPGERELKAYAYEYSVRFFEGYYLTREAGEDGSILFDPMFFRSKLPTPGFHWAWRRCIARYRNFMAAGPRGGAKTFFHALNIIHWMSTCPMWGVTYATSANELAEEMGDRVKFQLYENRRINDDFAPEYGSASLKPRRSEGKQGMSSFKLTNRAEFFSTSSESRQRGLRPNKYVLDDPEWDPRKPEATERNAESTRRLIFDVALPMVQQAGTSLIWTGTYISLRHYLWQAMATDVVTLKDGRTVEVARNPRFRNWTRVITPCEIDNPDGTVSSIWPEMWPRDDAEKEALGLDPDTRTLVQIREELGDDVYNTEMKCQPGAAKGAFFPPLTRERHGYWVSNEDALFHSDPINSGARIHFISYKGNETIEQAMQLRDLIHAFPRVALCDATWSENINSDYRTCIICAVTDVNDLIVLDAWAKQTGEDEHTEAIMEMSQKWLASTIGVEGIGAGKLLGSRLTSICKNRSQDVLGIHHWPSVYIFNPGITAKEVKIARIKWRFSHSKVKLPWHLLDTWPWGMLRSQIANFHPGIRDGGLEKDDMLDTLSFTQYVIGGRPTQIDKTPTVKRTALDQMLDGQITDPVTGTLNAYEALLTASPEQVYQMLHKISPPHTTESELSI